MISNLEQTHTPKPCNRRKQNFWRRQRPGSLIMKWYISLPCGLLVGPQEDFHILMDVLHLFESFEELLQNESPHKIINFQ